MPAKKHKKKKKKKRDGKPKNCSPTGAATNGANFISKFGAGYPPALAPEQ
jgi:hypothetical protein